MSAEDRIRGADRLAKSGVHTGVRVKDASTLIILDRSAPEIRFLAGRRSAKHSFMPGMYVFPGGRLDRADHFTTPSTPLAPEVEAKLSLASSSKMNERRAQALAVAAIRETYEETGLIIGNEPTATRRGMGFQPDLQKLRFIARAITPPGRVKRYDTRFFALFSDEVGVDPEHAKPSEELERLEWVSIHESASVKLPEITRAILTDLSESLDSDPALPFGRPVPFYYVRNRRFVREEL